MTKVSLRVYNREIEGMIEAGQLDEAIAHCQHILKSFPMCIETYRLLGKTFLEARRYADAADIFQRALMAVPDDFVSHVGMSIICDDEGKLDDAIWHMERAFEVQPSNSAIQGELRRLYGRRDGVEPSKIRLSRDALANMYSQGELFNQAIAEIRAVLAEDPNRPDLQVMLARANYRAGKKVEAAEMAAALLKKYPYCLDALRVLVDVLPGTARGESTQIYRHRLDMLDPYSSFVADSVFASDQVADTAVNMERLEYKAGAVPASSQPGWASSLGIQLSGEKRAEPVPDWMNTTQATEQPSIAPEPSESAPNSAPIDSSVPDWMRSAGWQESTGSGQVSPVGSGQEQESPAEPIAQADIPDWLKSMAPPEVAEAENTASEEFVEPQSIGGDGIPDWLKSMAPAATAGAANAETEPSPAETPSANAEPEPAKDGVFPDWLKSMAPAATAGAANTETEPSPVETPPTNAEPEPAKDGVFPDWLVSLGGGADTGTAAVSEPIVPETPRNEEQPASVQPAPVEMLKPEDQPTPAQPEPVPTEPVTQEPTIPAVSAIGSEGGPFQPTGDVKPLGIGDDALGWLESLAAKQGAKPEELLTKPQERSEEMPDWLRPVDEPTPAPAVQKLEKTPRETLPLQPLASFVEKPVSAPAPVADEVVPELEEAPSPQSQNEEINQPVTIQDDTMAWLEQLAASQGAKPEELLTKPEDRPEATPEWIQNASVEQPVASTEIPASPEPEILKSEPTSSEEDITITAWLNSLDKPGAAADIPSVPPVQEESRAAQEDLPDWLKDLEKPASSSAPVEPEADLPDWLRQPAQPAAHEQAPQSSVLEPASEPAPEPEMPAWMEETQANTGQAAPTAPDEWVPAERPTTGLDIAPAAETSPDTEPVSLPVETPIQPSTFKGTGVLAHIPVHNKDAEALSIAQTALENNSLDEAMKEYGKLIKKGRLLDEVIHDLREAIYRYPVDVIVWQTLGDAYMRANRLQDALDAYTKAEELLR